MKEKRGIVSFGAYVPRRRLQRAVIAAAHAWANPGLKSAAKGERAICSHDEDSITMAVAAGQYALRDTPYEIAALTFASTTMPFADRQNATLIGEALGLTEALRTTDIGGSLRAGVAGLRSALEDSGLSLVIAADKRLAKPASTQELALGDGAAAIVTGTEGLIAELIATTAISVDFVDHYRGGGAQFDYQLEERWVREQGTGQIIPKALNGLLAEAKVEPSEIDHLVTGGIPARNVRAIADKVGIDGDALVHDAHDICGDTGTAHPLLLLTTALQRAVAGETILLLGFGQGAEAMLFRATEEIGRAKDMIGATDMIEDGVEDDNYLRFLSFNGHLNVDWGMREERDNRTAQSAFYRHRDTVSRFVGGRCSACDTPQFPRSRVCANPECREMDTQQPEPFAHKPASVKSFTEDWLALSYNPPLMYGNVRFDGGGVAMLEFADFEPGELSVGKPLQMQFRLKDVDPKRGFRRYCWKAAMPRHMHDQLQSGECQNG